MKSKLEIIRARELKVKRDRNEIRNEERGLKLKPCPFCGYKGSPLFYMTQSKGDHYCDDPIYYVSCSSELGGCGVKFSDRNRDIVIKKWNTRWNKKARN